MYCDGYGLLLISSNHGTGRHSYAFEILSKIAKPYNMKGQLIFTTIACIIFIACSKKNNSSLPPETFKEYFRGKLNGVVFNDTSLGSILSTPDNGLQINGYHANGGISLWLKPYSGSTGENLVNQSNSAFVGNNGGLYYAGFINGKIQGTGKISILEITNNFIRGTFDFIAPADSNYAILPTQFVTEGEFKLKKP